MPQPDLLGGHRTQRSSRARLASHGGLGFSCRGRLGRKGVQEHGAKLATLCISALFVATSSFAASPGLHDSVGAVRHHDRPGHRDEIDDTPNRSGDSYGADQGEVGSTTSLSIPSSTGSADFIERLNFNEQLVKGYTIIAIIKRCTVMIDENLMSKIDDKIRQLRTKSGFDEDEVSNMENLATSAVTKSHENSLIYCYFANLNATRLANEYVSTPIINGDGGLLQNEAFGQWRIFLNLCVVTTAPAQDNRSNVTFNFQSTQIAIIFQDKSWHLSAGQHVHAVIEADGLDVPTTDVGAKIAGTYLYALVPKAHFSALAGAGSISLKLAAPYEQTLRFDVHGLGSAARRLGSCMTRKGYLPG